MISLFAALAASTSALAFHPAPHAATVQATPPAAVRTDLGNGLYMIVNQGGNILFSTGDDGTFVVDTQYANTAETNLELITEISDTPVVFVLNTHFHGDHTGGNETFYNEGATVLAHENVRKRLAEATGDAAVPANALPAITFSENTTFYWNDHEIRVTHPAPAHTDGDAMVFIPDANVIHTGDIMFSGRYPYIDLGAGGTVDGALTALRAVHKMADKDTKIVPGHGPLSTRKDVKATIDMIESAREIVRAEMMKGMSREDIVAADPLKAYNEKWSWQFIDGDRMTGTLFDDLLATDDEAKAAVEAGPAEPEAPAAEEAAAEEAPAALEAVAERLEEAKEETEEAVDEARSRAADVIDDLASGGSDDTNETPDE